MALIEYFPNYIWNLSVAMALESGGNLATLAGNTTGLASTVATAASALPAKLLIVGGSDGTNARALSTDTAGRANVNINGTVPVSGTFWQATQPVSLASLPALATGSNAIGSITNTAFGISGTLPAFAATPTVNLGTLNGAATDASVVGLQVAQGSTTSGQKGALTLGEIGRAHV